MNLFMPMTPQQIYEELTGGPGSITLYDAQRISRNQSDREKDRADKITQLANKIQGGWQGSAADRAYGAATPLALAAIGGAGHLAQAQDLLDRQGGSFGRASNSVVPMPEKRPEVGMLDEMLPTESDTEKQVKAYQADAQHNIQVFEGYDNASSYNENMPRDYTITNHSGGTISVTGGSGDTIDSDDFRPPGGESGGPGNYSAPSGGDPGGTRGSPGGPSGGGPLPGGPFPGGSSGSQTTPNEYRPSPVPGYPSSGYPQSPAAHQPPSAPPGFGPGTVGGYPGGSGSGGGAGSGGRGGGSGGAGGPGAGGRVPGPGGSAGALAAEEAAVRRGAVGAGAAGRGGMGAMGAPTGAGRGKDDDEEHSRKVLIEADAEDTFGSDVLTAPQVIGDDAYED